MMEMDDEAQEAARELAAKLADARRVQREGDLRAVMAQQAGRRVLWWLIDDVAGTFSGSFCGESTHETAHAEGRRAVGREVLQEVQRLAPADYLRALQEALAAAEKLPG